MKITPRHPPPIAAEINALEWRIGRLIPPSFREFVAKYNGAEVTPATFDFHDENGDNGSIVSSLLSITDDRYGHGIAQTLAVFASRIPTDLLPIGRDGCGNLILLADSGPNIGKVYFWDHEREADPDEGETPDYSNVWLIADSFEAFLAGLYEQSEVEAPGKQERR